MQRCVIPAVGDLNDGMKSDETNDPAHHFTNCLLSFYVKENALPHARWASEIHALFS